MRVIIFWDNILVLQNVSREMHQFVANSKGARYKSRDTEDTYYSAHVIHPFVRWSCTIQEETED